jgi:hemolysin-activating ACP:hemolysin acyltransferase
MMKLEALAPDGEDRNMGRNLSISAGLSPFGSIRIIIQTLSRSSLNSLVNAIVDKTGDCLITIQFAHS